MFSEDVIISSRLFSRTTYTTVCSPSVLIKTDEGLECRIAREVPSPAVMAYCSIKSSLAALATGLADVSAAAVAGDNGDATDIPSGPDANLPDVANAAIAIGGVFAEFSNISDPVIAVGFQDAVVAADLLSVCGRPEAADDDAAAAAAAAAISATVADGDTPVRLAALRWRRTDFRWLTLVWAAAPDASQSPRPCLASQCMSIELVAAIWWLKLELPIVCGRGHCGTGLSANVCRECAKVLNSSSSLSGYASIHGGPSSKDSLWYCSQRTF